jgi:hypothetical protein
MNRPDVPRDRRTIMATQQQPAFTAYTVTKREGQEDWWTPIGAAFPHKNGDGYNIILRTIPLDGKIVLRPPKSDDSDNNADSDRETVRETNDRRRDTRR